MWTTEHTITIDASRESIWKVWTDVENWPSWDKGVEWCRLDGNFTKDATYTLKPVDGPEVKSRITDCQYLSRFADVSSLPLAKMEFEHEMLEVPGGVKITHRIRISGLTSFLFARVIGEKNAIGLPESMEKLARRAKELS